MRIKFIDKIRNKINECTKSFFILDESSVNRFGKVASILLKFAQKYEITIGKYHREGPDWIFRFRHPQGGIGNIGAHENNDNNIMIYAYWWWDDYDSDRRDSKIANNIICTSDEKDLMEALNSKLLEVLSWQKCDLTLGEEGLHCWRELYSKADFYQQYEQYSIPKI